jgi:nucleotide-binding universal stress UspA family protein
VVSIASRERPEKRLRSSEEIKRGYNSLRAATKEQEMVSAKVETVLVPLNGSPEPEAALPYAVSIARAFDAAVRLLGVIETGTDVSFVKNADQNGESVESLRDAARTYLAAKAAELETQGLETSTAIAVGNVAEEILRDADQAHTSAIVMATHGRGGLERWALGSVADKVMRMAHVPTLLVRPSEPPDGLSRVELRHLLVPLDGSSLAEAAIAPAARLAKATGASLTLLRVEPWLTSKAMFAGQLYAIPNLSELEEDVETAAKDYLARASLDVPHDVPCRAVLQRGFATITIEAYAEQKRVDLVVMSTHGSGGLTRLVVGSNADRLVRSGVPTLLIHPFMVSNEEQRTRIGASTTT